jgi:hypothetical protein
MGNGYCKYCKKESIKNPLAKCPLIHSCWEHHLAKDNGVCKGAYMHYSRGWYWHRCKNKVSDGVKFCDKCTCSRDGCNQERYYITDNDNVDSQAYSEITTCNDHICHMCHIKENNGECKYCSTCVCDIKNCNKFKYDRWYYYCEEHKCELYECHNSIVAGKKGCKHHVCIVYGCDDVIHCEKTLFCRNCLNTNDAVAFVQRCMTQDIQCASYVHKLSTMYIKNVKQLESTQL